MNMATQTNQGTRIDHPPSFRQLLQVLDGQAESTAQKGMAFERLVKALLQKAK